MSAGLDGCMAEAAVQAETGDMMLVTEGNGLIDGPPYLALIARPRGDRPQYKDTDQDDHASGEEEPAEGVH